MKSEDSISTGHKNVYVNHEKTVITSQSRSSEITIECLNETEHSLKNRLIVFLFTQAENAVEN